jgi:ABC-type thiamine transport system substrate-binding protein
MLTPEDQAVLKQMLKNVDVATIAVENAQEEIERAITTGDRKKVEYALGVMESATERLIGYAKSYKEVVRQLA